MGVRGFVSFDSDFSKGSSSLWGKDVPPGRDLTEHLVLALKAKGLSCSDVDQHDSYGWYFEVTRDEAVIWCMLQLSDNWLLITRRSVPLLQRLFGKTSEEPHQRVCEAINSVMSVDSKFRNVLWFTAEEFQRDFQA